MATPTNTGYKSEILNVDINDASWTSVPFAAIPNNLLIVSRGQLEMKMSLDPAGATFITIPSGQSLTYDSNLSKDTGIYLQAASGTDTAEIIATYEG